MRGVILLCFILALPPLAALGHDLYLAYGTEVDLSQPLKQSDLGWLWQNYHLDSYNWAVKQIDPQTWKTYVSPVLRQRSSIVAAVPIAIVLPIVLLLRIIGLWPFQGVGLLAKRKKIKSDFVFPSDRDAGKKRYKYKRK